LIEELQVEGFNIVPCRKGKDSVKNGLARLNEKTIVSEQKDTEFHKELNNYVWSDKKSNTPVDKYNHVIDAVRYAYDELTTENNFWIT